MTQYSPLASPAATRAVLDEAGLAAKHRLGQNFLISDTVVGKILDFAELGAGDTVLEVGPGIGTLTLALATEAPRILAVEADAEMLGVLEHTCASIADKLQLIHADALKLPSTSLLWHASDGCALPPTKLVANLPYQIAATLVLRLMAELETLERAVVMVQAEVADRMAAPAGTKAYGAYTAKLALVGRVIGRFEVGPANFMPPPHVDSAVVCIERKLACNPVTGAALSAAERAQTIRVIDAAFAQRRKTLRNCLVAAGYARPQLDGALEAAGIDGTRRAETLVPAEFIRLAAELARYEQGGETRG